MTGKEEEERANNFKQLSNKKKKRLGRKEKMLLRSNRIKKVTEALGWELASEQGDFKSMYCWKFNYPMKLYITFMKNNTRVIYLK